jgi:photosystem II stability/assembly factor-like uncharacterized protein
LYAAHYGTVQAVGLNAKDPETIYAGTDNGILWKTTDLGGSWTRMGENDLSGHWITHVAVEPNDPNELYVTFSGYRSGDGKAYVLRSTDGGESWKDISANLPKAPVNDAVLAGGHLYVATDVGVFVTDTKEISWWRLGKDLPRSPVNDLRYSAKNDSLYAGTFGRGIYVIEL